MFLDLQREYISLSAKKEPLYRDLFFKKLLRIKKNQTDILSDNQLDFDVSYTYMYIMNEFLTAEIKGLKPPKIFMRR
jgi:hypothetical protein